jgi:hypothetical protein
MGLRSKMKSKLKGLVENFSGEFSSAAPDEIKAYERTGVPSDPSKLPRARLNRPKAAKADVTKKPDVVEKKD